MADVSDARQALRDYAREIAAVTQLTVVSDSDFMPKRTIIGVSNDTERFDVGTRGELVGHVFEALQGVLTLAETDGIVTAKEIFAVVQKSFER